MGELNPSSATGHISRPRLTSLLTERFQARVLIVRAGAGFGKTVALQQALTENTLVGDGRDVWIPVREYGNHPDLILGRMASELGLRSDDGVAALIAHVLSLAPEQICFCIDDAHLLSDLSAIGDLIERLPANGHLCLATRHTLPLKLTRLRAAGLVTVVDEDALLFNGDELIAFADHLGTSTDAIRGSGGWPAHAVLLARAGPHVASQFILEEVVNDTDPLVRRDLAVWVQVGRMSRVLVDKVFDELSWTTIESIPLVDIDDSGAKLHDLWCDALVETGDEVDIRAAVCHVASLVVVDDPTRSLELWLKGEAWPEILAFFRECTLGSRDPPRLPQVEAVLDALPAQYRDAPEALMAEALLALNVDAELAYMLYQRAADGFADAFDPHGEAAALLNWGNLAQAARLVDDIVVVRSRAERLARAGDDRLVDSRDILRIMEHRTHLRARTALELLDRLTKRSESPAILAMVPWLRASLNLQLGRPDDSVVAAMQALESDSQTVRALATASLGWAFWLRGDLDKTIELMERSFEIVEARDDPTWTQTAAAYFGWALLMTGRHDEGVALARRAREIETSSVVNRAAVTATHALELVCGGDEAGAQRLLRTASTADVDSGDMIRRTAALWYVFVPLTRPRLDEAEGCYRHAVSLARALLASRQDEPRTIAGLTIPDAGLVGAFLPPPWAAELAIALSDVGRTAEAASLVTALCDDVRDRISHAHSAEPTEAAAGLLSALPRRPLCRWRIELIGPPRLLRDGQPVSVETHWRRSRVRELVMYLSDARSTTRGQVMTAMWPHFDERKARRNLEVTLSYAIALLDGDRTSGERPYFIRVDGDRITLADGAMLETDIEDFDDALDRAAACETRAAPHAALEYYRRAAALYRGVPFELKGDPDWVEVPRRRVTTRVAQSCSRAAELLTALDETDEAIDLANLAVTADPWHERSQRALIWAYVQSARLGEARAALKVYSDLAVELGIEQSAEIQGLVVRLNQVDSSGEMHR